MDPRLLLGYQGYRNAKFGRIECHEAINAHARAILLDSKTRLEAAGWHVVHGIVDSLWVTPVDTDPEPLEAVIDAISEDAGIALEHDGTYEWVCFVPRRNATAGTVDGVASAGPAGALTKYFGKRTDGTYKYRGIECRQHSTPAFIADAQQAFIETLDREHDPAAVCDRLEREVGALRRGAVDPADLLITKRVSKPLAAYQQETHTVGALRRYAAADMDRQPGQSVTYVVVDDGASRARERVRLDFEEPATYDVDFYVDQLVRACESVTSPLGWDRTRLRRALEDGRTVGLSSFLEG
ncbi:MAG: hypothetical protein U5K37_01115 [Natrialbaceae archaeon]|nr:hypothetical protein [Natrialbaceae archaeon]